MARQGLKKRWKVVKRGAAFQLFLTWVNDQFLHGGRGKRAHLDLRGPGYPQRVIAEAPNGRMYRLTLQSNLPSIYAELYENEFIPLTLGEVTKFEVYDDPQGKADNAGGHS
jgi:hypothetical protein